ncbi:HalOD1 output domain-containing protein [Salinigranum halophilum]|uniref:HalOD1 output domain-containing protein n=1 Tax=Salinigranum halophilum TaxID=2565931 RepID=UPI0010A75A75|nr:HalOD1 output domain-containing protein [Salinigranum halophilum]
MPLADHPAPSETALTTTWREERLEVDPATNTYRARCRADEVVSTAVVLTVAALRDCAPTDLPPLLTAVDPDALAGLVTHESTTAMTTFVYADCTVTVRSTGDVSVTPARRP